MKYYIASRLENAAQVRQLKAILDERGWEHTYDWTVHGSVQSEGVERIAEVAEKELDGVLQADVVIVLLPGGRGAHAELGMAIMATSLTYPYKQTDERVVIFSPNPAADFGTDSTTCAFYHHPLVERFSSWDEMIATFLTECGA